MRQVFNRAFQTTFATGDTGYVLSERIDSGYILHVHACFAYAPDRDANDRIIIGIRNGGLDVILKALSPLATQEGDAVATDFYVGENDQVYGYFPDSENGDTIGINLNGVLIPRRLWEHLPE